MKYLIKTGLMTLLLTFVGSQLSAQEVFAATDKSLRTDFSKLKTYTWASYAKNTEDAIFTLNDLVLKKRVREAIEYELAARGYKKVDSNADFMVNFRVFDGEAKFPGYVDVYKDENYWTPDELRKDMIGIVPEAEVRERDDMRNYRFKDGTLLIDFVDTDTYARIWTGYASGVKDDYVLDRELAGIRKAVQKIFAEYQFTAGEGA